MAGTTDVKSLLLEVDASVELLRRNLTRGDQAVGQFENETRARLDRVDRRFEQLGSGLRQLPRTIARTRADIATIGTAATRAEQQVRAASAGIRTALLASTAAIGAAFSATQIRDYADGYTRYTNQLKVAGLEGEALAKTQDDLFAIAQRYGVQLESVGTLYGRLSQGARELGASQSDLLRFTNGVGAALTRETAAAQRRQAAAARDAAADARAYTAAERQANNDIAAARADLSGSAAERAAIERARIEAERQSRNEELGEQAKQGRFGTGETAKARTLELQRLNNERAALETQVVDAAERQRAADEALAIAQAGRQNEQDILRAQSNIATTASERRRIELRLLDLQYDEERARLDGIIASREASDAEKLIARDRKAALAGLQATDRRDVERQNAGPLDQYRERLRQAAGDMNEALDGVKANGLASLEDGLASIVTGTESAGSAFKRMAASIIADLARIAIQKAILSAIGTSFLGFSEGGEIPGFAAGGSLGGVIRGPGTGKSDSILALLTGPDGGAVRLSAGETIMNERASDEFAPLLAAMNAGRLRRFARGGPIGTASLPSLRAPAQPDLSRMSPRRADRLEVSMTTAVEASPLLLAKVVETSVQTVSAAADPIAELAEGRTRRSLARPALSDGWL